MSATLVIRTLLLGVARVTGEGKRVDHRFVAKVESDRRLRPKTSRDGSKRCRFCPALLETMEDYARHLLEEHLDKL